MSPESVLQLDYDEQSDVLYISVGEPQAALSLEIDTDIFLRYVPPLSDVVGITIVDFLSHFPLSPRHMFTEHAMHIVTDLLMKYPQVPMHLSQ